MNDTETFQHYQVLKREDGSLWELGRGAMGVTYKAFDTNLRCAVALKVISAQFLDSEMARARFLREARAAAGLRHRNVASVYHLGNDADSFFYSMEFIDGLTVESLVAERGPLPAADALQIALQVARALGAAAKQGVVHRDIKPANLMVVHEDEDEEQGFVVKVIDFGLARSAVAGGENSGHITMGGFVGTPQYASPEQIEEKDLDVRSDIYSLGITLWYMLAGQPPFTGTVFRISSQHLTKEPPWEDLESRVPPPVRALLARMLQKDPAQRPQTPAKLRVEIDECLRALPADGSPGLAAPASPARSDTTFPEDEAVASVTVVQGPAPTEGRIFSGRYQLDKLTGEGPSGRTFRAYDGRLDGKLVALKVFHPALHLTPQAFYHLQGDHGRLRDAPHPQLVETFSLERVHGYKFSVMEWVNGHPLAAIERPGGAWPLPDALRLLGLVADAAAHCSAHRLHRLELSSHKILLGFPDLAEEAPPPPVALLAERALDQWPRFTLKVDALAPAREGERTSARGSSATGGPRTHSRDTVSSIRGLVEGSYFYALGALLCELLGAPAPGPDSVHDLPPVAALNENGHAVLKRAFTANPGFGTENEFFQALLQACGLTREEIGLGRPLADDPSPSSLRTTVRATAATPPTETRPAPLSAPPLTSRLRPAVPAAPKPPAASPALPADARTLTRDHADTYVPTERAAPPPPPPIPVEPRARPATSVPPPGGVSAPPPASRERPATHFPPPDRTPAPPPAPVVAPSEPGSAAALPPVQPTATLWPEAAPPAGRAVEPEAETFAPSAPVPEVFGVSEPTGEASLPGRSGGLSEAPVDLAPGSPAARVAPVPLVAKHPEGKKFPLGPALAVAAVVVIGGFIALFVSSKPRPSPPGKPEIRDASAASVTPPNHAPPGAESTPARQETAALTPAPTIAPVEGAAPTSTPATASFPPVLGATAPTTVPTLDAGPEPPPATMEVVPEATPATVPTPVPATPLPSPVVSAPTPAATPAPTPPRRDNKNPTPAPTVKGNRPPAPTPKPPLPDRTGANKPKPTPAKPPKPTPSRKDDDTPDFLR